ncbi:hypothetical protein MP478_15980 [Chryseobacterium sp. WG14]|uniref:hypothetical protein n=1 Tax=unclassified Chryseobacterium TaxID=2593645 RepID=UPI001D21EB16|nr:MULTISPECIES: hypothetical protein [unclassified Chryseobacterium]MCQ9640885.1 hypothetical protein [Chryseobacterium sp. WG14]CAH0250461.1 hypothetical protein SRABI04_03217 [Chryseobacterium sp. Bi04]
MNSIFFEYKLENEIFDNIKIKYYDIYDLKKSFSGVIYIHIHYSTGERKEIILETGILDYINQFDSMFSHIDEGNNEAFTVSYDFYSNSLDYLYNEHTNELVISESNAGLFKINCNYDDFKQSYKKFRKKTLNKLIVSFPQLKENSAFKKYFIDC